MGGRYKIGDKNFHNFSYSIHADQQGLGGVILASELLIVQGDIASKKYLGRAPHTE